MAKLYRPLHGVLLFDKPLEFSSNAALQKARWLFKAEKAGHTGTLDPLATGLLPICFGEATKFSNALLDADKAYRATIRLGQITTTGDREGELVQDVPVQLSLAEIEAVLPRFVGKITQVPPMHSALKFQGKPLYEYIRRGETIERPKREIIIHELILESFEAVELVIHVRCSKGTYIRTLAEDIGLALGCGAHLSALRRTAIGHYSLQQALNVTDIEAMDELSRLAFILPVDCLMPALPCLSLDAVLTSRIMQGQRLAMDHGLPDGQVKLYGPEGFIGTAMLQGRRVSPHRLLSNVARAAA